jgi:glutathione synthase/RimK-type ligase-like ATP-grasp enzyme
VILLITLAKDLHAYAVAERVQSLSDHVCHIIECDTVAQKISLSLVLGGDDRDFIVNTEGREVSVSSSRLAWLRRPRGLQNICDIDDDKVREIINNDCRGAFTGILQSRFRGKWISAPEATYRASDKIYQLSIAAEVGFRIPRTLVSQSREEVIKFWSQNDNGIIVKAVVGAHQTFLLTRQLKNPRIFTESAYMAAPAIYQEFIPGKRHIRLHCFGDRSFAATIITEDVDWRPNLTAAITSWPVPRDLHMRIRTVLDRLGLEMGIVDLKQDQNGDFVWFEVNPQGQFIYLDSLTDLNLTQKFAEYLISEYETLT